MIKVSFHDYNNQNIRFVVIASRYKGKWIFAKHRLRDSLEIPGGHVEKGEHFYEASKRELMEETGATSFEIEEVACYSVLRNFAEELSFGMLYFAEVFELGEINSEIERIELLDEIPENLTYPYIQPALFNRVLEYLKEKEEIS